MCVIKEIIDNGNGTETAILKGYVEPENYSPCLICGNPISIPSVEWQSPHICNECKQAMAWVKDKMKEECK